MVADQLGDMIEQQTNPTIATYALTGETTIRVTARCNSDQEGAALLQPVVQQIQTGWVAWFTPSMGNRWNGFAPVCWKRRARPWL